MYDLLKLLNDRSAGDLAELDNNELQRFETLCETGERSSRLNVPAGSHCPVRRAPGLNSYNDRHPTGAHGSLH